MAQLLQAGVAIQPDEAVAIVQQLIHGSGPRRIAADVTPPFGPPTVENVQIAADGSVACVGCEAAFAISELAIFLQTLLPEGQAVAGGLRYTIARGVLDVDAPPFDSVGDFSRALARYEAAERQEVISRLFQRAAAPPAERRRADPAIAQLRRQLRAADARVYDQQLAIDALGAQIRATPFDRRAPLRVRKLTIAAGIAAGLLLVGAGETWEWRPSQAATAGVSEQRESAVPIEARPAAVVADEPSAKAVVKPPADRPSMKRASSPRVSEKRTRFRWLRSKIAFRAEPL